MTFAQEQYSTELWHEMKPMLRSHHAEIANKFYGKFDPDISFYESASPMMRIFTMRNNRVLVGYQIFFILSDPHSHGRTQAVQDVLYIDESERKGWTAYRFMKWCISQLQDVDMIVQRISARHDFGKVFERLGFQLEDLSYTMEVA